MVPELRRAYNEAFTPEQYQQLLRTFEREYPGQLDFRVAETPVFLPGELRDKLVRAGEDIIDVLAAPDFKQRTEGAVPPHLRVPHEDAHPAFLALDYAVCRDAAGALEPQLIELQGFPSLYVFQDYLAGVFREHAPIPATLTHLFGATGTDDYLRQLRELIVGDEAPENVVLLELFPERQKTRIDFALTRHELGVAPVCITRVRKDGRQLYYERDGRRIDIKRIYNRLIFDELERYPDLKLDFHPTDPAVNVTWVGHPNWFFRVSKYTLPLLRSPFVPPSHYLADLAAYPADLANYVLKPLFSFAGAGVRLAVTPVELDAIQDKRNYLLQRKVAYEPVIQAPDGLVKCEIRMLYAWPAAAARPRLLTNLCRLSRGAMIGVDFNKDKDWVGGTVGFHER